jgi:hypothetical protein
MVLLSEMKVNGAVDDCGLKSFPHRRKMNLL